MRKFFRDLHGHCIPFYPFVAIMAAMALLFWFLIPTAAKAQTVCTYTEQTGTTRNCTGTVQLNQVTNVVNGSGTITTGGASQQVFAANAARQLLIIQNPTTATEPLYVDFGRAADATNSIALAPGGVVQFMGGVTPTQYISVMAATTGHAFVAKQGGQ